jgi:snapalysin
MRGKRVAAGLLAMAAPFVLQPATGPSADAATITTLYYSSSGAGDYAGQIDQAAANWNTAVDDVRLVKGGTGSTGSTATIVFHETDDGQGSYTTTDGHGHGAIYLDAQQVAEGYSVTRIAAHELGHNLGLPDDYSGPCSELMSGHGPGTSCTNALPSAAEAAQVERNFVNGFAPAGVLHRIAG